MKTLSIRAGIWLWMVVFATILLLAFSWLTLSSVRRTLEEALDLELQGRARVIANFCEWEEDGDRFSYEHEEGERVLAEVGNSGGVDIRLLPSGARLLSNGIAMPRLESDEILPSLPAERLSGANFDFESSESQSRVLRICRLRVRVAAQEGDDDEGDKPEYEFLVRVGLPTSDINDRMETISLRILTLCGLAVAAVALFGDFLSRRFVKPLQDLEQAAGEARSGKLVFMPQRGNGDEIDQLALTLDGAFNSLRAALDRQSRFTANAAHELRNPIAVIRNAAEVAGRRERSPEEYRAFMADIAVTSARMGNVVAALLTLARLDAGTRQAEFAEVDLGDVVAAAREALSNEQRERVTVQTEGATRIRGDADLLRMLVDNILGNALRHAEVCEAIEVGLDRQGDRLRLVVRDHGPGIPAGQVEKVFEPFFRGDADTVGIEGVGLGLSIVAAVVRIHGGTCTIEDANPGARVLVDLPLL